MNGAYGGGAWGGPPMAGGAKMAAIHQCLDALRPPSPPLQRHAAPIASMPALDALPSPLEPFCPPPLAPPPQAEAPPQTIVAAQVPIEAASSMPPLEIHRIAPKTTTTTPVEGPDNSVCAVAAPSATTSARATAALRSPAVLALGAAIVVVLVLVVVAPPFVLKRRGGPGASTDPAWRWARPRAQVDPIRLLAWGMLAAAAAFVLPLAIERLIATPTDHGPKTGGLFCRKRTQT
nr:hypothetical protein [Pandoravirus aubagnensis]